MNYWVSLLLSGAMISFALFLWLFAHMRTIQYHNPERAVTCGLTGFKIAKKILEENGLPGLPIQNDSNTRTAFYRPQEGKQGTIHLPPHIYAGVSLYAVAISAHECGHALQSHYGHSHFSSCRLALALFLLCIGMTLFLGNVWVALVAGLSGLWWTIGTLQDESDATRRGTSSLKKTGVDRPRTHRWFPSTTVFFRWLHIKHIGCYVIAIAPLNLMKNSLVYRVGNTSTVMPYKPNTFSILKKIDCTHK